MAAGIGVWALHFAVIYTITTIACARAAPHIVPWSIGVATIIALALASAIVVTGYRKRSDFVDWMAAGVAALAILAIVWEAAALPWAPACEGPVL
jgi:hypothetical protein